MKISGMHIKFLHGVGERKAAILAEEIGVYTYEDLLYYIPYRYIDRSKFYKVDELSDSMPYVQLRVRIRDFNVVGNGANMRLTARAYDETGSIELLWFKGYKYVQSQLDLNKEYILFGKPAKFNHYFNIVHPELSEYDKKGAHIGGFQAMYETTEKMKRSFLNSRAITKLQETIFKTLNDKIPETLPSWFIQQHNLMYLHDALYAIHFPSNPDELDRAIYRLKFEELFYIQLNTLKQKFKRKLYFRGHHFARVGDMFNRFYTDYLPFELTDAQKRVVKEIRQDCGNGRQMNRLLQGDVGSGKTLVALLCMLLAVDNGYQACLMAPTEILATQHLETLKAFLKDMPIEVALLTGSTKKKDRTVIHERLRNGQLNILVGTHALLEDVVMFDNLGLVIIDEQHRFGVAQRARLWQKNSIPPHVLVMTATPIPRTLAMTLYGDLDVSVIDQLPPGRKPITTYHTYMNKRDKVFAFIHEELKKGRQAYIVYPLIFESEKFDYQSLEEGYEQVNGYFQPLGYNTSIVHGKLKPAEKDEEMRRFAENKTQILVATTVIEVGVNVPNASIMVIESSERFGLSQLHQLRGRVGRGAEQSFCILMSSYKLGADTKKRLETMVRTNDGFEIAEADMKLRGQGDIHGTQQSGLACSLKVANLGRDTLLLSQVSAIASAILEADPDLVKEENQLFNTQICRLSKSHIEWKFIS
ncbi:MAG: ATP-dependent DNA helicase RecG [Marinifilaceae bacterium]